MEHMLLPDVEQNPQPCPYRHLIGTMRLQNSEYPQIWHLRSSVDVLRHTLNAGRPPCSC